MKKAEVQRLSQAPERIWLQVGDDDEVTLGLDVMAEVNWNEVTWCRDKIFNHDIEYVRIDHCKGAKSTQ